VDGRRLAKEERADFAVSLAPLPRKQWQAATLCPGWRARDVVAHVISYDDVGIRELVMVEAQCQLRISRVNAAALARYDRHSPEQRLALLTDHPDRGDGSRHSAAGLP
jgi:uncharacterized protein (TIGR03083 family)